MNSTVRNFRQAIEKVVPRKKTTRYEGGYFSGNKFDRRELVRRVPLGDERIYMRQTEVPQGEPRLFTGLLIDNSGSMLGTKSNVARKAGIFMSRVHQDMDIPFMGASFGSEVSVWKTFQQDFDNPTERVKPALIDATAAYAGATNLHAGLDTIIEAMNQQRRRTPDSHGIIYVITDGAANTGLIGKELKDYIDQHRGRLTFKVFGLSGSSEERELMQEVLSFYFGGENSAFPETFEDLPDEAFRVLRTDLMRFQRFLS